MQRNIKAGTITVPEQKLQRQLHQQLGEFAKWLQKPKDASQVQKDKQKSVPIAMLPMVF
ncbi:MAG: hypothetical protein ACO1N9_07115 [Flavobacterium sp.]